MRILYFPIFQRGFEVLNAKFQASVYVTIITVILYYNLYHCYKNFEYFIIVVELLMYSKKDFPI